MTTRPTAEKRSGNYALRNFAFEKRRGGPASALEKHHERIKQQYASNPDIDTERSAMNFHLVQPRAKYYSEIQRRIEKAQKENPKCKVRKDSVKFIDTIPMCNQDRCPCRTPIVLSLHSEESS